MSETREKDGTSDNMEKSSGSENPELNLVVVLEPEIKHDLVPIHSLLLDHAIHLQEKVNREIYNIGLVRRKLAREM